MGISRKEALLHAGVVDTQELILGGGHVNEVRLTLGAFLVQELVYRLVSRGLAQVGADDLIERLAQMGRTALGSRIALGDVLAGLVHSRIVSANQKMSFFAGMKCNFSPVSRYRVCSLDYPLLVSLKPVKS